MEPVSDGAFISLACAPEEGELQIKRLCQRVLAGWQQVPEQGIKISKISGGTSNLLVKVSPPALPDSSPRLRAVAVKVFGDKTELLIDRKAEQRTLIRLGAMGFGSKVLAVFANGRVEEFLSAVTLTPTDMADPFFVPRIARKLRQLHMVELGPVHPGLVFGTIQGWMDMVKNLEFGNDPVKAGRFAQLDLTAMQAELDETQKLCEAIISPVVFAHNDLHSGNILVIQAETVDVSEPSQCDRSGPLQLIDFEYSVAGYRGFDWGNHFNEYAGFDCDYSRYPDASAQALFFKHYMADPSTDGTGPVEPASLSEEELQRLSAEANLFALASHIYWGVWALVQARYSPIEFDYLEYSALRWSEYTKRKPEFVAAAKQALGLA